jgi:hypothetical protein
MSAECVGTTKRGRGSSIAEQVYECVDTLLVVVVEARKTLESRGFKWQAVPTPRTYLNREDSFGDAVCETCLEMGIS